LTKDEERLIHLNHLDQDLFDLSANDIKDDYLDDFLFPGINANQSKHSQVNTNNNHNYFSFSGIILDSHKFDSAKEKEQNKFEKDKFLPVNADENDLLEFEHDEINTE